jgi:hypothetical protein
MGQILSSGPSSGNNNNGDNGETPSIPPLPVPSPLEDREMHGLRHMMEINQRRGEDYLEDPLVAIDNSSYTNLSKFKRLQIPKDEDNFVVAFTVDQVSSFLLFFDAN